MRDYVELNFDGPILRALSSPTLVLAGRRYDFPGAGSRDALCRLIGRTVLQTRDESDRLSLEFSGGSRLVIPKASAAAGPEVAHLVPIAHGKLDVASMGMWENLIPTRRPR